MNVWSYDSLSSVHIEMSSKCNAACPGCMRFIQNSPIINPDLIQDEITYDMFVKWFPPEVLSKIYGWIMCGNYGDPLACRDLYKILEYISEYSPGSIQINTNAGLRSPEVYKKIGELFARRRRYNGETPYRAITFSIDGLEDTNHIYRRNVKWKKVWENLMAYIETGAFAKWDFLQFKHNVHQIDEARKIAKQYGIDFILKNPFGVEKKAMPVYNKDLKLEYIIEHATDNGYPPYNPAPPNWVAPMPEPVKESGCINCIAKRTGPWPYDQKEIVEIFVNTAGQVLPCCFVGNRMSITHMEDAIQVRKIQKSMGNANNLNLHSLKEILDGNILDIWSNSWNDKSIAICWNQCGGNDTKERAVDFLFKDKD
jgi:MoaA/NifB/PqqE/SkfB family radical SAM enzyme